MAELLFTERPDLVDEVRVAYCPERVLPGNVMYELIHNDRVIGGVDQASTDAAIEFYRQFVESELYPTNAKTAERRHGKVRKRPKRIIMRKCEFISIQKLCLYSSH